MLETVQPMANTVGDDLFIGKDFPRRRTMSRILLVCVALVILSGCDDNKIPSRIAEAHNQAEDLRSKVEDLQSKVTELQSDIDRFDTDDWKEVVPDIRSKVSELDDDCSALSDIATPLEAQLESLETDTTPSDDDGDY